MCTHALPSHAFAVGSTKHISYFQLGSIKTSAAVPFVAVRKHGTDWVQSGLHPYILGLDPALPSNGQPLGAE